MSLKTQGLSYKLVADLLTSVVAFAVGYFGVELDPALAAVVAKAIGFVAGVIAPPNPVVMEPNPQQGGEAGLTLLETVIVLLVVAVVILAVLVL